MKTIQQIKSDFEQILSEVVKINGISVESAVQVATVILQESGKYNRCPERNEDNGDNCESATQNQKQAMKNLRLVFTENISKADASKQIEQAVAKLRSNGKGRASAPSLF
jgi:hypothetical protein